MKHILPLALLLMLVAACDTHFMTDELYRQRVEQDFKNRKATLPVGDLFRVFAAELSDYEREALTFLYAYMPLADMADYPGSFHLMNIRAARRAVKEMPWGKSVPEELFRHFVLPVRVNNEPLDSARIVFYEELKPRVEKLSMKDAILEVNHWCHEKVVYQPSDSRTSAPLATIRTAYGRCGEESTLLVAALRSIGIPARQVYTPRWAHTDSNHAWVEAWAEGAWHFLGACEPEPILNLGWFNAPASRGMLMHTKVFGRYEGPEEVMTVTPRYTEINVIDNYAPTASACITVVNAAGQPVPDALVEFKLYNYAEFYTVAAKQSGVDGSCSLTAGRGDMLVWASKDGKFGFSKLTFGKDDTLTVVLDKTGETGYTVDLDIVPPVESVSLPEVSAELREANNRRLAQEDSIRSAYTSTFMTDEQARDFARRYGLDEEVAAPLLVASRGNHSVISNFMARLRSEKSKRGGLGMLQAISAKDLRDVKLSILLDHMLSRARISNADNFRRFVRNPRISNEELTPYKAFFAENLPEADAKLFEQDPMKLVEWVATHIRIDADCNLGSTPISPAGVWQARVADAHSRDIFFVAVARSLGIPARIHEVTGRVQLIGEWEATDVDFEKKQRSETNNSGVLAAIYRPTQTVDNPKYYAHFSLSKITEEGRLKLLTYAKANDNSEGTTWENLLKKGTSLEVGNYVLVTGTRLANGAVLTRLTSFVIRPYQRTTVDLMMREDEEKVQVVGSFNSESLFAPIHLSTLRKTVGEVQLSKQSLLQACGRGYFVVGVLGVNQEPTNHALRDIATLKTELEKWGHTLLLLFPDVEQARKFQTADFPGLPSTIMYGIDTDGISNQIIKEMKLGDGKSLPLFIIADTFNRVVFVSQGYTIGLGEQLMKTVRGL